MQQQPPQGWEPPPNQQWTQYPPQQQSPQQPPPDWPPQQYSQQIPPQQYPPQFPIQPPPKKKSRKGLWIGLAVLVLLLALCGVIGSGLSKSNTASTTPVTTTSSGQQATQPSASTPTPTHQAKWTTTHIFSGNGIKKTASFAVPDDWKILWSCTSGNNVGVDGVLVVTVYSSTTPVDVAVNSTCKAGGKTSDSTEEHQGGTVYLDINATGDWSVQVQELK